jgi:hypothetical protein
MTKVTIVSSTDSPDETAAVCAVHEIGGKSLDSVKAYHRPSLARFFNCHRSEVDEKVQTALDTAVRRGVTEPFEHPTVVLSISGVESDRAINEVWTYFQRIQTPPSEGSKPTFTVSMSLSGVMRLDSEVSDTDKGREIADAVYETVSEIAPKSMVAYEEYR